MIVLGIETSCDETAASVVQLDTGTLLKDGPKATGAHLLSNVVATSMDLHAAYGGVVPEIAARSHIESIIPVIDQALIQAFGSPSSRLEVQNSKNKAATKNDKRNMIHVPDPWGQIDAIAVTYGAGLGGSLLVGVMTAKTLAMTKDTPLYGINHVEGHVYANFLTATALSGYSLPSSTPTFPLLALIVSGGHSQLVLFRDHFDYTLLGQTRDDAIGEAFDKVAKIIGLPYPGGPSIANAAKSGDSNKYPLPKAKLEHRYDYSFSGLKTAVLRLAQAEIGEDHTFPSHMLASRLSTAQKHDIAASFQKVAIETVVDKTMTAFEEFAPATIVIAGGVAANQELRRQLTDRLDQLLDGADNQKCLEVKDILHFTDPKLCTDNGAMIATLGCYKASLNQPSIDPQDLQISPNLSM